MSESEDSRSGVASDLPGVEIEVHARTDVGCVREHNEDSFLVADLSTGSRGLVPQVTRHVAGENGTLLLVCDGMGGAAAGEVASALAVETLFAEMMSAQSTLLGEEAVAKAVRRAVRTANRRIVQSARANPGQRGMGTTLSGAVLCGDSLLLAQVGDSRGYLFRSGHLVQVTQDQSVAAALIQAGRLSPEEARSFAHSNIILQALGTSENVEAALSRVRLCHGDRLLLCSDGLHGQLSDATIAQVLAEKSSLEEACSDLVTRVRAAGAPDNVTVVLARFTGKSLAVPANDDPPKHVELPPDEESERPTRISRRMSARHASTSEDQSTGSEASTLASGPEESKAPSSTDSEPRDAQDEPKDDDNPGGSAPAQVRIRSKSGIPKAAWIIAVFLLVALIAILFWKPSGG
ncbi:MAG: serine/threonine-protein phosphatase [Deltaproteobacteria bacterium]|nr:serine/threonine-protein phosphatase [Deltaproteobacteria bacterium]